MRRTRPGYCTIRTATLLVAASVLLTACETGGGGPSNPVAELATYGAAGRARAAEQQDVAKTGDKAAEQPKSRAQRAMDCWALAEKTRANASLEARADFVNDCMDGKVKPAGGKADSKSVKPRERKDSKPAS